MQPGSIASCLSAKLLLDRGIDQDAVHLRQSGRHAQQRGDPRGPCGRNDIAPIRPHQAAQLDRVPLRRRQGLAGAHVQTDIGVQTDLVADMATRHRPPARLGNILHQQRRQPRGDGLSAK